MLGYVVENGPFCYAYICTMCRQLSAASLPDVFMSECDRQFFFPHFSSDASVCCHIYMSDSAFKSDASGLLLPTSQMLLVCCDLQVRCFWFVVTYKSDASGLL